MPLMIIFRNTKNMCISQIKYALEEHLLAIVTNAVIFELLQKTPHMYTRPKRSAGALIKSAALRHFKNNTSPSTEVTDVQDLGYVQLILY